MAVKVREVRPGKWALVIDYQGLRKQAMMESYEEAVKMQPQVEMMLKLQGAEALSIFDKPKAAKLPTLESFASQWLSELAQSDLKPTTQASYESLMRLHVFPELGSLPLDQITYPFIKKLIVTKAETLSKNTCRLIVATLRACLQEAVREGLIKSNPAQGLGRFYKSAAKKESADPFTPKELKKIFKRLGKTDYPAVYFLHRTGMRVGEIRALKVSDVDLEAGDAYVYRNWPSVGGLSDSTKTHVSRHVHLAPDVVQAVREFLRWRREYFLSEGIPQPDWLFCSPEGKDLNTRNFYRRFKAAQEKAKVRVRGFHSLRDTFASSRLSEGKSVLWVAAQLGNKPATVLKYYAKWIPSEETVKIRNESATVRDKGKSE